MEAILQDSPLPSSTSSTPFATEQAPRTAFETPTPQHLVRARHNLPVQTTPFVGRDSELADLARLLADPATRQITILGPGGMGKTRLSLEAAGRFVDGTSATNIAFPDGVFLAELATATSMDQMITAVATAFGFAIERDLEPAATNHQLHV